MVLERNCVTCGFCRCFNLSCKQLFNDFGKVFSATFFIQLTCTHFHQDRMLWCSTNRASLLLSRLNYLDTFLGWYSLFLRQVRKAFSFPKVINMKCRLTFSLSILPSPFSLSLTFSRKVLVDVELVAHQIDIDRKFWMLWKNSKLIFTFT